MLTPWKLGSHSQCLLASRPHCRQPNCPGRFPTTRMGPSTYKGMIQCAWPQTRLGAWFLLLRLLHSLDGMLPARPSRPLQLLAGRVNTFGRGICLGLPQVNPLRKCTISCFMPWFCLISDGFPRLSMASAIWKTRKLGVLKGQRESRYSAPIDVLAHEQLSTSLQICFQNRAGSDVPTSALSN